MGARNAAAGRLKGLTSPRKFAAMQGAYEAHRDGGRLPATCEVVFAQAWVPRTRHRTSTPGRVDSSQLREQLAAQTRGLRPGRA